MLSLKINDQVYAAFSVPIFQSKMEKVEELNEEVCGFLLNERLKASAENEFDWATQPDLHNREIPCIQSIVNMFGNAIAHVTRMEFDQEIPAKEIGISADVWGSLTRGGCVKSMLNFAPLHWRGIYFPKLAGPVFIELADPSGPRPVPATGKYAKAPRKLVLEPGEGTAVLFPAWITHSVVYTASENLNIAVEIAAGVMVTDSEEKP